MQNSAAGRLLGMATRGTKTQFVPLVLLVVKQHFSPGRTRYRKRQDLTFTDNVTCAAANFARGSLASAIWMRPINRSAASCQGSTACRRGPHCCRNRRLLPGSSKFARLEIFFSRRIAFGYDDRFRVETEGKAIPPGPMAASCCPPERFRPLGGFCP